MYRILFFTCFLTSIVVNAQIQKASYQLSGKRFEEAYSQKASWGIALMFRNERKYEIKILTTSLVQRYSKAFVIENQDKRAIFIGSSATDKKINMYFFIQKSNRIETVEFSIDDASYKVIILSTLEQDEEIVRGINTENEFILITYLKKDNKLAFRHSKDGVFSWPKFYKVEIPNFYKTISTNISRLAQQPYSDVGIDEVYDYQDNDLIQTGSDRKIYYNYPYLYITVDKKESTYLIKYHVDSQEFQYKKLNFELSDIYNTKEMDGNSIIYKNILYRISLAADQLNVCSIDLDSMILMKNFNFYPEEKFKYKNTGFLYVKTEGDHKSVDYIKDKEGFFKKCLLLNPAIAVNKLDDEYISIEVGASDMSLRSIISNGGFNNMSSSGLSMGMGLASMPTYTTILITEAVSFKYIVQLNDQNHTEGHITKSFIERIDDYVTERFKSSPPELVTTFSTNELSTYYGYFARANNMYNLIEFKK